MKENLSITSNDDLEINLIDVYDLFGRKSLSSYPDNKDLESVIFEVSKKLTIPGVYLINCYHSTILKSC